MRSKLFKFALAATIGLVLASTFSCTNVDGDENPSSSSTNPNLNPNLNLNPNITAPATPTGLRATVSANTIVVTWNAVAGAAGYVLYYSLDPNFSQYGYEVVSGTSYIESDIPPGTYYFIVTSYNSNEDESGISNIVVATVTGGGINPSSSSGNGTVGGVPATPTGLRVTVSSNTISLSWNAVAGAVGYVLYYSLDPNFSEYDYEIVSGTSYIESDIPPGTYYFLVTAYNANEDESDPSNIVMATVTGGSTPNPTPGDAFTSIAAMKTWLTGQPDNTPFTPYTIKLNVSDLGGSATAAASVGRTLRDNPTKYVILDLSGSTFATIVADAFGAYSANNRALTLVGIIIPNTVTTIASNAFRGTGLASIDIPSSVKTIGANAFQDCTSLTDVTIGNGLLSIEGSAFAGCTSLTSIIIPNSVTAIGNNAFQNCKALTSAVIGIGVTSIGSNVFQGCISLTSVSIGSSVTSIGSSAFAGCTSLTSVIIPNSVTTIGGSAFNGCTSLANLTIGSSVTSIEGSAFNGCTSLASVKFEGNDVATFGYSSIVNSTATTNLANAYKAGGAGTYTRSANNWTKLN